MGSDDLRVLLALGYTIDILIQIQRAPPLPKASSNEAKKMRQEVFDKFPFLYYASKEILKHDNQSAYSLDQESFLEAFDLDKWIRTAHMCESHEMRRHNRRANLVYVLAENNLARLIKALDRHDAWLRLAERDTSFRFLLPLPLSTTSTLLLCEESSAILSY